MASDAGGTSRLSSATSSKFRQSTHLIPTPASLGNARPKRFEPIIMKWPFVIGTPLLMFFLGLGLEIAIWLSNKNDGFKVPRADIFNVFGDVSAQFIASFFPTLAILPVAFTWRELDWNVRWYQPYVVLQKGRAKAEESLLLDYIALGPLLSLFRAMQYKHRVVFWSSMTAMVTYFFQPLTGSIFQIRSVPQTDIASVVNLKSIGLAPDIPNLDAFIGAAGYVEASVLHGLGDPPFISKGWTTAEFTFPPKPYLNGTLTYDTVGIQTNANCSNPVEKPVIIAPTGSSTQTSIVSRSIDGCAHSVTFDPAIASQQYGVDAVPCPGDAARQSPPFQPVVFWFYWNSQNSTQTMPNPEAQYVKTIFCTPRIAAFDVQTTSNLNDAKLTSVTKTGDFRGDNSVFGGEQAGRAMNGLIFENSTNVFIQAKAVATRSLVPHSIFKAASISPEGIQSAFESPNGFLDFTTTLYTRHLSVSYNSAFFVSQNSTFPATITSLVPRLKVDPLPGHILSFLLILTGLLGIIIHAINIRHRKTLRLLASAPGSIAAITSLTSRSGWGELLLPYDNEKEMERKLEGLTFVLDRRTGAILGESDEDEWEVHGKVDSHGGGSRDSAMLSLLGKTRQSDKYGSSSTGHPSNHDTEEDGDTIMARGSSYLSHQAAEGKLPWAHSWDHSRDATDSTSKTAYVP